MISRATFVYIVMLAVFGAGLWAILSFGSILLRAPQDLAGTWELIEPDGENHRTIRIEQSGRFFKITHDGLHMSMKMVEEARESDGPVEMVRVKLAGPDGELRFAGPNHSEEFNLRASGTLNGQWLARRIERTHPRPASSRPPATPSTAPTTHARL